MKITPLDIRRKEFKRSMRGYSDEEVDIFLDEVADEFERIFQENMELQDRTHRLDEQIAGHAQLKDALEKTLVSAQLQAEELRANAHKESELILRDAELKARGIVNESYSETQKMQQALVQLKLLEEDFRFKFHSLLEGYLRLLNQAPLAAAGVEPAAQQPVVQQAVSVSETPTPAELPAAPAEPASGSEAFDLVPAMSAPPVFRPISNDGTAQDAVVGSNDSPTLETEGVETGTFETAETSPVLPMADGVAVPDGPKMEEPLREEPTRGFFFGRQMEDIDDTFAGEDGAGKDKTRDFEW